MLHLRDVLQLRDVIPQTIISPNCHWSTADTDTRLKTRIVATSHLQCINCYLWLVRTANIYGRIIVGNFGSSYKQQGVISVKFTRNICGLGSSGTTQSVLFHIPNNFSQSFFVKLVVLYWRKFLSLLIVSQLKTLVASWNNCANL